MPRNINEGIATSPTFTPHRVNVEAPDDTDLSTLLQSHGMFASPFDQVIAQVNVQHAAPDLDIEVLTYNDLAGQFAPQSPAVKFEGITGPVNLRFNVAGQRFYLHCSGTFDQVDISIAGVPMEDQMA